MTSPLGSREKILSAARDLFYHVGYQATSVDDILRRCGVAKSNFYYHFESKEQLGIAVLDERVLEFELMLMVSLNNADLEPSIRLEKFLAQLCHLQRDVQHLAGCPFGNLAAALPSSYGDPRYDRFRARLSEMFHRMETAASDCLSDGMKAGHFRSDLSPADTAVLLVASLEGLMILTKTHQDARALESGMRMLTQLLSSSPPD